MATTIVPVSADAHVNEPHNLWFERLPESMRASAPRYIEPDSRGFHQLVVNDDPVGWKHVLPSRALELDEERIGAATPDVRLQMMADDGIGGEIVYPTIGLYIWDIADAGVGEESCRVYNDWMYERLGSASDRIKLAAMIPTWEVDAAIREVARSAERGFASAMMPLTGTPPWNAPEWDPLWAVLEETGLPATLHQGTGNKGGIVYRGPGSAQANLLTAETQAPRTVALLTCSGTLERHPGLHVVLVETNGGWLAWCMELLDEYSSDWSRPALAELPSHYIARQVHCTFQNDPVAIANLPLIGAQTLLWGNDYPHGEGTYPNSQKVIGELFRDVGHDDRQRILADNAIEIFGFDREVVSEPVQMG
jgi:predicted TIM-barrel fold metal-dependent hydrolase